MMSCLLCSDLKEINKKITLLDIGSGFDPIFGEKTRPKQPSAEKCFMYYKKYFRMIINLKNIACYKFIK